MRLSLLAAAASLSPLMPVTAWADTPPQNLPEGVDADSRVLAAVEVTRLPTIPSEAVDVVIITRDEIDLRQAVSPRDVLNTVPGLAVERSGAFGGLIAVRQRGAPTDKSLILLDGVPLNDVSQPNGSTDLGLIDMEGVTCDEPDCKVPWPTARNHAAVLAPWLDMDPDARLGKDPVSFLLAMAPDTAQVGLLTDNWIIGGTL